MRTAKAEYIRALKDLRAADAEYRRAEAAVQQANAAYRQAETAWMQEQVNNQKLLNELQALKNEAKAMDNEQKAAEIANEIDKIEKAMAEREVQHATNMVNLENNLAKAEEDLRVALRDIALKAQSLTQAEKDAVFKAVEAYEKGFELVAKQKITVLEKEQALAKAEYELSLADKTIGDDWQYVDYLEYYKEKLLQAEASALLNGVALAAIGYDFDNPDNTKNIIIPEELSEWKKEIEALEDSLAVLDYSKHENIIEMTNYYVAHVHDGYKTFNENVAAFQAEWDTDETDPFFNPPKNPGPAKTQDDFKFDTTTDSLAIPAITVKTSDAGFPIYKKFADLVGEYDNLPAPQGKFKVNHNIAELDATTPGEVKLNVYSTTKLKGFIFGNTTGEVVKAPNYKDFEGNDVKGKTAAYGIDGAISVLDRELVLAEKADDTDYEKLLHEADSTWQADRKVLENGLAAYAPYVSAKTALTALGDGGKAAFFAAVKNLSKELTEINGDEELNFNDSSAVLGAIAQYAAARDKYLNDVDGDGKAVKYAGGKNPKYFYMAIGKNAEGAILDSVLFSEINTQTRVKAVYYEYDKEYVHRDPSTEIGTRVASKVRGLDFALCNILNQLFPGKNMGDEIFGSSAIALTLPIATTTTIFTPAYTIDSWEDPKNVTDPTDYVPKAIVDAEEDVNDAIADYVAIYENYWDATYPATLTCASTADDIKDARAKEYSVGIYTKETFEEPYTIVSFLSDKALYNNGLGAILSLIEPDAALKAAHPDQQDWKAGVNLVGNHIFGVTNNTTFSKYLIAKQNEETHGALLPYKAALDEIKVWAEKVRKVFDDAIAKNGTPNKTAYENWKNTYGPEKAEWEEYAEARAEFTGTYPAEEGETPDWIDADSTALMFYDFIIFADDAYDEFKDFYHKDEVKFPEMVSKDPIYDIYTGKWDKEVAGKQLALANQLFPQLPENMKAWQDEIDATKDKEYHVETLKTAYDKAYTSAAKAKYTDKDGKPLTGSDLAEVIENLQKDVLAAFADVVKNYNEAVGYEDGGIVFKGDIQRYTEYIRDYEKDVVIGGVHPAQKALEQAKQDLAVEQNRLAGYEQALAYAKANLDKILEYLKSLDVNFVVLTNADLQNIPSVE